MRKTVVALGMTFAVLGASGASAQPLPGVVEVETNAPPAEPNPVFEIVHRGGDPLITECPSGERLTGDVAYCLPDGFDGHEINESQVLTAQVEVGDGAAVTQCLAGEHVAADVCVVDEP